MASDLPTSQPNGITPEMSSDDLERRMKIELRDIGIPPRPVILTQIDEEMAKDEPDFLHLARLLGQDVGLAAGMIKVANSPYFGLAKKVPTVQEALLVLGLKLTIKTVAGLALQQVFKHVPNMERFWDASARIAETAAMIARDHGNGDRIRPEDAHTFALFRDCGIPMLMIPFPEYREVLAKANGEAELAFTTVEDRAIGLNHAQLGTQLAEDWLLPEDICLAISHHHEHAALLGEVDIPARSRRMIAIAQLAEHLVQAQSGQSQTREWDKLGDACLSCLNLSPDDLPELAKTCVLPAT